MITLPSKGCEEDSWHSTGRATEGAWQVRGQMPLLLVNIFMLNICLLSQLRPVLDKEAKTQHLPYSSICLQIETPDGSGFHMILTGEKK